MTISYENLNDKEANLLSTLNHTKYEKQILYFHEFLETKKNSTSGNNFKIFKFTTAS